MKQKLLKTWLMLVCLLASAGSVWAESYTITFGNGVKSATPIAETTKATTVIANGTDFVTTQPFKFDGNCYYGDTQTCIRVGKSGVEATLNIALSEAGQVNATSIVVNAMNFGGNKNVGGTLSVNGAEAQVIDDAAAADYTFEVNKNIQNITLSASKATYIYSITVNYGNSGEPTPQPTKYSVAIADGIQNGTVTASVASATAGATITLTATPAEGYEFGAWDVKGNNGSAISVTSNQFTMPEQDVLVSATFNKKPTGGNKVYASLAELVAAGEPTSEGEEVTVTLTNDEIVDIYVTGQGYRNGIYFMAGGQKLELYYRNVPEAWVKGGKVSGTITCPWKLFKTTWELAPELDTWSWNNLTYTAPEGGNPEGGDPEGGDPEKDQPTFNLAKDNPAIASMEQMLWNNDIVTILADKAKSQTPANNYYPGSSTPRTSTRFYTGSTLTIAPAAGYSITSIVCDATTTGYATTLVKSEWANAAASNEGMVITIIPENGKLPVVATLSNIVGLTGITINYETTETATIAVNEACTDGEMVYATYSLNAAWEVPADLIVSEVKVVDGALALASYNTGDVVPANTGVLVSALEGGNYDLVLSRSAGSSVLGEQNMLRPASEAMSGAATYYRLTMHKGEEIGFWWGAANGAAFTIAPNKAYLAVPSASIKADNLWFGEATAIANVTDKSNDTLFNLAGQRIMNATKGVYVKNGKKFIVK